MKYFVVDAFTEKVFGGNPAGVCVLEKAISEKLMENIAKENNLSETAFVYKEYKHYCLRWFTPEGEIDLCGHATMGTAYVISNFVDKDANSMEFHTKSGILYNIYCMSMKFAVSCNKATGKTDAACSEESLEIQGKSLQA